MKKRSLPFRIRRRFPSSVINDACRALDTALSGTPHTRWFVDSCIYPGGRFDVVRIDYKHRLVRQVNRRYWELMRHQEYDKIRF